MKRYIKWLLVVVAVLVPVVAVAWGVAVYFSAEHQERNVRGTVIYAGEFNVDIDSLRRAVEDATCPISADEMPGPISGPRFGADSSVEELVLARTRERERERLKTQACGRWREYRIEQASHGMLVEICNRSLYQVDWMEWVVRGYWRGRSSAYDALADLNPAPIDPTLDPMEMVQALRIREFTRGLTTQVRSDKILTRDECYTVTRRGTFTAYDSLEVVITGVRLSGAPW